MKWTELPSEVKWSDMSVLTKRLSFVDAVALLGLQPERRPLVFCQSDAISRINAHSQSRDVELGGLLVGRIFRTFGSEKIVAAVEIVQAVPSDEFSSTPVSLSMGPHVWQKAAIYRNDGLNVVGWYHTHPNLGAYFSSTDVKTQREFFRESFSLGLVVDPIRNEEAWFIGAESQPVPAASIIKGINLRC